MTSNENDANVANYAEIQGHIDIIKAKLASTAAPGGRERLEEDLTDYYERAVQMRAMRVTTLEEELREQQQALARMGSTYRLVNKQRIVAIAIALLATALAVLEMVESGFTYKLVGQLPIWKAASHGSAILVGVLLYKACSSNATPPAGHKKL